MSNLRWVHCDNARMRMYCTATTYNLLTNYLLLREILIKCTSTRRNS